MTINKLKQWHFHSRKLGLKNWSLIQKISAGIVTSCIFIIHPLPGILFCAVLPIIYPSPSLSRFQLSNLIKNNNVIPFYQAKFNSNRKLCGCEALARITIEDKILYPNEFIDLALRTGLISSLDKLMLINSIRDLTSWIKQGLVSPENFTLSFNVDRATLLNNGIVDEIIGIIVSSKIPSSMLEIEVTERTIDSDRPEDKFLVLSNIQKIKDLTGIRLAIDDFTLGHSSAETLLTLPVDTIKIDRIFVSIENSAKFKFILLISNFAREIGCKTVLEGIETEEQHTHFSKIFAINEYQGYLFHKPSNKFDFEKLLSQN